MRGRPKQKPDIDLPPAFERALFSMLAGKEKVTVGDFGTFRIVRIPAKKTFHNFSGKTRTVAAHYKLKFTQSAEMKDRLNSK